MIAGTKFQPGHPADTDNTKHINGGDYSFKGHCMHFDKIAIAILPQLAATTVVIPTHYTPLQHRMELAGTKDK